MAINPFRKGGNDTIPISEGGTGATTGSGALANMGGLTAATHAVTDHTGVPGVGDLTVPAHAGINHTGIPGVGISIEIRELTWSGSTTPQTTPALGFTPKAAIIIAALQNGGTVSTATMSVGFATGTGTSSTPTNRQVGVATNADNSGSDNDDVVAYDTNDVIGSLMSNRSVGALPTTFTQQTGTPTRVRVTQFSSSGITLDPQGTSVTGKAFLLIFGN